MPGREEHRAEVLRPQFFLGGGILCNAERGSARLYGGLGAVPPVGSRGKAQVGGSGGRSPPEAEAFLSEKPSWKP